MNKLSQAVEAEIRAMEELPDSEIDRSDIPEGADWTGAVRGRFQRASDIETSGGRLRRRGAK